MKKVSVYLGVIVVIMALQAFNFDNEAKKNKKRLYEFPLEMAADVQAQYIPLCDKGYVLYTLNCAKCHSTMLKGKEIIPDFTPAQLSGYELRVLNANHESNLPEENISPEELGYISLFLTYKKKNAK